MTQSLFLFSPKFIKSLLLDLCVRFAIPANVYLNTDYAFLTYASDGLENAYMHYKMHLSFPVLRNIPIYNIVP